MIGELDLGIRFFFGVRLNQFDKGLLQGRTQHH
jgi:hypothetical protein